MDTMLSLDKICFSYGGKTLFQELSLEIREGEIATLIGLSGSGKTTLFRLTMGLISPHSGSIRKKGQKAAEGPLFASYMQQEDLLLPWRSVMGNMLLLGELGTRGNKEGLARISHKHSSRFGQTVLPDDKERAEGRVKLTLPRGYLKSDSETDGQSGRTVGEKCGLEEKALQMLSRVGLRGYENNFPEELSGGMRQRVSLARALLQERPLLLLDEPFGSLDVIIREELYGLLKEIRTSLGKTILLVTHDFRDALALSDRIFVLSQGKIGEQYIVGEEDQESLSKKIRSALRQSSLSPSGLFVDAHKDAELCPQKES